MPALSRLAIGILVGAAGLAPSTSTLANQGETNTTTTSTTTTTSAPGVREATGTTENGAWRLTSFPSGSVFSSGPYEPPECMYLGEETRTDVPFLGGRELTPEDFEVLTPEEALEIERRDVTTSEPASGGSYRFVEVPVDRENTDQDLVDGINATLRGHVFWLDGNGIADAIEIAFTPLDEQFRRFKIWCVTPDGALDDSQYDLFVDVPATDPAFGLRAHLTHLYNVIEIVPMEIAEPEQADNWGGLVVRSPTWLAVDAADWQARIASEDVHLGWRTAMIATPTTLDYLVDFEPSEADAGDLAFTGRVPCIGSAPSDYARRLGSVEMPAEPLDLVEWSDGGSPGPCIFTPPARGTVTITAEVTYTITATTTISGATYSVPQPSLTRTVGSVTFDVGELRAVNVNSID